MVPIEPSKRFLVTVPYPTNGVTEHVMHMKIEQIQTSTVIFDNNNLGFVYYILLHLCLTCIHMWSTVLFAL